MLTDHGNTECEQPCEQPRQSRKRRAGARTCSACRPSLLETRAPFLVALDRPAAYADGDNDLCAERRPGIPAPPVVVLASEVRVVVICFDEPRRRSWLYPSSTLGCHSIRSRRRSAQRSRKG